MTDTQKAQIDRMRSNGCGYGAIAQELGLSSNTVKSYCRRNKLSGTAASPSAEKAPAPQESKMAYCECCGKEIQQTEGRKRKRFCSDACRNKWWNAHLHLVKRRAVYKYRCPVCGEIFEAYGNSRRKFCSVQCSVKSKSRRRAG